MSAEPVNPFEKAALEWLRGCSCASTGKPEECEPCTSAFLIHIKTLAPPPRTESFARVFHIWAEGYQVNEGRSRATFMGQAPGETFAEACATLAEQNPEFSKHFDPERLTYWGCRLFENEQAARASFG